MQETTEKLKPTNHEAEAIMGQYLFAAGCGAAGQWVKLEAVQMLRSHYLESIQRALEKRHEWQDDASHILHYMQVIGRLAASKATAAGRASIDGDTMARAVSTVEENYTGPGGRCPSGVWCERATH